MWSLGQAVRKRTKMPNNHNPYTDAHISHEFADEAVGCPSLSCPVNRAHESRSYYSRCLPVSLCPLCIRSLYCCPLTCLCFVLGLFCVWLRHKNSLTVFRLFVSALGPTHESPNSPISPRASRRNRSSSSDTLCTPLSDPLDARIPYYPPLFSFDQLYLSRTFAQTPRAGP